MWVGQRTKDWAGVPLEALSGERSTIKGDSREIEGPRLGA